MRLIKTQQDITTLCSANLFPTLLPHIQIYFNHLRDEIGDEGYRLFVLDKYGYIVILEAGDNLYDLECVGLNREDFRLLGSMPEYVETLQLNDMTVYKASSYTPTISS